MTIQLDLHHKYLRQQKFQEQPQILVFQEVIVQLRIEFYSVLQQELLIGHLQ